MYAVVPRGEVRFLDANPASGVPASEAAEDEYGDREPCIATHNGAQGMAYFAKLDAAALFSGAWWFDKASLYSLPVARAGQCHFVAYLDMLQLTSMEDFAGRDRMFWVVQESDVMCFPSPQLSQQQVQQLEQQQVQVKEQAQQRVVAQKVATHSVLKPKGNAITPAAAASRTSAALSEGLTTGCSSLSACSERSADAKSNSFDGKEVTYRIPGPSDRTRLPESGRGSRNKSDEIKRAEAQQIVEANDAWMGMRDSVGWTLKWDGSTLLDNENYMTPYTGAIVGSIENLECFHTKAALMAHIEANPCLKDNWKDLWPMLQASGWVYSKGKYMSTSDGGDRPGMTSFRSKLAVTQFVARFPYPLQEDARLAKTLQEQGWGKRSGKNFASNSQDRVGVPLESIRKRLWKSPLDLFALPSIIPRSRLEEAVFLSREIALSEDLEPDTPLKKSTDKVSGLDDFMATVGEWKNVVKDEDHVAKFASLLNDDGWEQHECSPFAGEWWQFELITTAPWCGKGDRKLKKPLIGSEAFWGLEDIFRYIKTHGSRKPAKVVKPMALQLDYRKPEMTLDGRIKEIASLHQQHFRGEKKKSLFYDMLLSSGWKKVAPPKGISSNLKGKQIYAPFWSADTICSNNLYEYQLDRDYFCNETDMLKYLEKHGNVQARSTPSRSQSRTPERDSRSSYQLGNDATSETRYSPRSVSPRLPGDETLNALIYDFRDQVASEERFPNFNAIWNYLKKIGWKNLSTTGRNAVTEAVHVPPWSRHYEMGNKKLDVEADLVKNRDYFEEREDVWRYLNKYGSAPTENEPTQRDFVRARQAVVLEPVPARGRGAKRARVESVQSSPAGEPKKAHKLGELTEEEMALALGSDEDGEESEVTDEDEEDDESGEDAMDIEDADEESAESLRLCDGFTADYKTLLDAAVSKRNPLHLRKVAEVIKFLNVKNRLREVQVKKGELDVKYYHRVDAWMKKTTIPAKELIGYADNWDYFEDATALWKFIRSQFAVRGHVSLNRAALKEFVNEHKYDDEFQIRYNPHDVGEVSAPPHAIAEHLAGQPAGSPCWN